jgi:hypothetical protein
VLDLLIVPDSPVPGRKSSPGTHALVRAGTRVLVVEDNQVNRVIVGRMLSALGCEVEFASNGFECLERVDRARFELILMDCHMPGMDGFEAARAIRARESGGAQRMPIVALSASALPADVEACREAGMDDFVSKPLSRDRLAATVRHWTDRARASAS